MRVLVKFRIPVEPGNEVIRSGRVGDILQRIMQDLQLEAAYFAPEGVERAGLLVIDMRDSSQVAEVAERFDLGLHATVEMTPVMALALGDAQFAQAWEDGDTLSLEQAAAEALAPYDASATPTDCRAWTPPAEYRHRCAYPPTPARTAQPILGRPGNLMGRANRR